MSHPVIAIYNAGKGDTPPCPQAAFKRGDVVSVSRRKPFRHMPAELVVLVAVPPGFPSEYALADLVDEARPLMITEPARVISYVLCREGDPKAYLIKERDLRATGRSIEVGSVKREGASS